MQISLRNSFLAVSILAFIFAVGTWATKDYRREQAIRKDLLALGAMHVHVDAQEGRPQIVLTVDCNTSTAELTKYGHLDWRQVGIEGEVNREMLVALGGLSNLGCLHFHECSIETRADLEPLRDLKGVELLLFSNSFINGEALDELKFVPQLKEAVFHMNTIAPNAIEKLAAALPQVRVHETSGVSGATVAVPNLSASPRSKDSSTTAGNAKPEVSSSLSR